jgi:hypothetical protein
MTGEYLKPDVLALILSCPDIRLADVDNFLQANYESSIEDDGDSANSRANNDKIWNRLTYLKIDSTYWCQDRHVSRPLALPLALKHLKIVDDDDDVVKHITELPVDLPRGLVTLDCSTCSRLQRLPVLKHHTPLLLYLDCRGCFDLNQQNLWPENLPDNLEVHGPPRIIEIPLAFWFQSSNLSLAFQRNA